MKISKEVASHIIGSWRGDSSPPKSPDPSLFTPQRSHPLSTPLLSSQHLQRLISDTKHRLSSQLFQFISARNESTQNLITNQSLSVSDLQSIIRVKDQEYLDIYCELAYELLNDQIERVRLLTLIPEEASNIELREIILSLRHVVVEIERSRLDEEERIEEIKDWEEFGDKVMVIREESEEVAAKLRSLIKKRGGSQNVTSTKRGDVSETIKVESKLRRLQQQLQSTTLELSQLTCKYRKVQRQLRESNNLVSQLRMQLSRINSKEMQEYSMLCIQKKLQKLKLNDLFNRKKRGGCESDTDYPFSSDTIQSSQRSIEARIEGAGKEEKLVNDPYQ